MKFESSPKTYDANLHETEDPARVERLENLAQDEIIYILDHYNVDEPTLAERYAGFSAVEWKLGDTSFLYKENGKTLRYNDEEGNADGLTRAFTYDMDRQNHRVYPAIYHHDSLSQFDLSHEMFHIMSTSVEDFIVGENEDIFSKKGIQVLTSDSSGRALWDNPFLVCPQSQALNEGITELLAKRFQRSKGNIEARSLEYDKYHQVDPIYRQCADLVDIMSAPNHNQIIEAYFADDPFAPRVFLDDFDVRQNFIDSSVLEHLDSPFSDFFPEESLKEGFIDDRIILACIEYAASFCNDADSLDDEWQRIIPIAERIIRRNLKLCNSSDQAINEYYEQISASLNDIYEKYR